MKVNKINNDLNLDNNLDKERERKQLKEMKRNLEQAKVNKESFDRLLKESINNLKNEEQVRK